MIIRLGVLRFLPLKRGILDRPKGRNRITRASEYRCPDTILQCSIFRLPMPRVPKEVIRWIADTECVVEVAQMFSPRVVAFETQLRTPGLDSHPETHDWLGRCRDGSKDQA